ncbi:MAG: alpha amylase C-terminal domain-containing protein, partial [Leeuwenhoekiella sp.]
NYKIGVPEYFKAGKPLYNIFNSNEIKYGGSGDHINEKVKVDGEGWNGRPNSITIHLPPLAISVFSLKKK